MPELTATQTEALAAIRDGGGAYAKLFPQEEGERIIPIANGSYIAQNGLHIGQKTINALVARDLIRTFPDLDQLVWVATPTEKGR